MLSVLQNEIISFPKQKLPALWVTLFILKKSFLFKTYTTEPVQYTFFLLSAPSKKGLITA